MEERCVLFGKYETGRLLGRGTFAKVYHAKHILSGDSVAVKVIAKDHVRKSGMIEQIKREISAARLVRHPNVVELKEVMATKSKIYIVMEHARGGELFAKVARGRLREDLARKYFQQLILAVDFCHSRGVSHRDLKPENLLVDGDGDLKVSDFGLSALPEQLRQDGLLHTRCGTPSYVAPEVLRKRGYDGAKADLWSCGVILYVLLAGFLPFKDENVMKMYGKIFKAEFEFPPWFSPESRRLISKLLVTDPAKRISIPAIMRVSWFRKNLNRQIKSPIEQSTVELEEKLSPESRSSTLSRQISSKIEQSVESEEESKSPKSSIEQSFESEEELRSRSKNQPPKSSISSWIEESTAKKLELEEESRSPKSIEQSEAKSRSPTFLNAFEFISSMASGFDLSSMFESERRLATMFTSRCSAGAIMASVEAMAREAGFRVWRVKEDFKVRMEGLEEGRRGRLLVAAELFEVAEGVAVVEITRVAGDTLEYDKFCRQSVRPGLKDIVWTWQGDNFCNGHDDEDGA